VASAGAEGGLAGGGTPDEATRSLLERILAEPTAADLWELQKTLVVLDTEPAGRARAVAREFHGCLRTLESKSSSRRASRLGAVLGSAAVGSVSLPDLLRTQDVALGELLQSSLPAILEIGSAISSAQAWEVEAGLIYDEFAWFLYGELWDVSSTALPELSRDERRGRIDQVVDPLLDASIPDADRAALLVEVFRAVLAARVVPLLGELA
jgi:hypothetical protein